MGRKKRVTDCDIGLHKRFLAMGGDSICQICGDRQPMLQVKEEPEEVPPESLDLDDWHAAFARTVYDCSTSRRPFTSAHIEAMIGKAPEDANMRSMMLSAESRDVIRRTGEIRDGRMEWVGT